MFDAIRQTVVGSAGFLLLSAALFAPLEQLAPVHGGRTRSRWPDAALLLAGALLLNLVAPWLMRLQAWADARPLAQLAHRQPTALLAGEVFLAVELLNYALHRAMHRYAWLWRFHEVHHASEKLDWLSAWRAHPVDVLLQAAAATLPGLALGFSLSQFAALVLLRRLWTSFIHANVKWKLSGLALFVATPAFHHGHHAAREGDANCNFAGTLPVLDRIFGTLRA